MRENTGRRSVTFTGGALLITLIWGLVMTTAPAEAQTDTTTRTARVASTGTNARWSGAINTGSLGAVNAAYWAQYAPKQQLSIDWLLGSISGCQAGLTSAATNAATLTSLNFVRSLAGLAPVSFSRALNDSAQRAALIMAANGSLSHSPSSSWRCWSPTGAAAASRSNLALAYPSLRAGQIIDLYMDDPGTDNVAAGHRRWILNPFSTVMGSGSTSTANALTVVGPTSASRPNPRWVGWPTAGYFPNAMEPRGRWSLGSGSKAVSFARASVAVYQNGVTRIPVHRYAVHTGYAQPTLVWQMPSSFNQNAAYKVVVTGIRKAGVRRALHAVYTVRLFTPSH
jgi:uncharacterized protein YkwD